MSAKKADKKTDKKTLRVKQVRSGIGCPRAMRETLKALGLGKMHRISQRPDSPETRGMIAKIPHLVQVMNEE
jgi:large subunit ribosomal protein L30